jgi:tetratricopeptide (TPR) repeat protein
MAVYRSLDRSVMLGTGAGVMLAVLVPTVPGVRQLGPAMATVLGVAASASIRERRRLPDGSRGASPLVTAVLLGLVIWLLRGWLDTIVDGGGWPRAVAVAIGVLLGLRLVVEVPLALAVVGGYMAPDASVFLALALPAAGAAATGLLVMPGLLSVVERAAMAALRAGREQAAQWLARVAIPAALLLHADDRARAWQLLATVHSVGGRPDRAAAWRRRLVAIWRLRGDVAEELRELYNLAAAERQAGRHERALEAIARGRHLVDHEVVEHRVRHAASRPQLRGIMAGRRGQEEFVRGARMHAELEKLDLLGVEINLLRNMGDLRRALAVADEALELIEGRGRERPGLLASLAELDDRDRAGWLAAALFRSESGEQLTAELARSARDRPTASRLRRLRRSQADLLRLKADVYNGDLHDYDEAGRLYERALRMVNGLDRTDLDDATLVFSLHMSIGAMRNRERRYAEAGEEFTRALEVAGAGLGDPGTPLAISSRILAQAGLANVARLQGYLDESVARYAEALGLSRTLRGWHWNDAFLLMGAGEAHLERGDLSTASDLMEQALERARPLNSESLVRVAHLGLGKVEEAAGRPEVAYEHYRRCVELLERTRSSFTEEADRLGFYAGEPRVEVYERMVATCLALGRQVEAFDYAERGKARAMLDALSGAQGAFR